MRFYDLLTMSINNLRRRKLRTALTVLGVIIGTASIMVMVSLGIGLQEITVEQYASFGSLTKIEVNGGNGFGNTGNEEDGFIVDDTIRQLSAIPHVKYVSPVLSTYLKLKQGVYETNTRLVGLSQEALKEIELSEGRIPDPNAGMPEYIVGNMVTRDFYNAKTGEGYWQTGVEPDVDLKDTPFFTIFEDYNTGKSKKFVFPACGFVKGSAEEYNEYSYGMYTDIDLLEAQLRKIYRKNPIPGQPTNKKGKPYPYIVYESASVYVDNMENVTEVQKAITDMGFQAYSSMEWLEQAQQQTNIMQAVLGGIGAVSLFVAAIGIANTMMMSIYERTKEIGVLKVLGCPLSDIRGMFLIEAGFIGFMGGVIGLILSYSISFLINKVAGPMFMGGMGMDNASISRIPPWLAAASVVFAVIIGMLAGLFPAIRAMKLSPLAAIRNE